MLAWRTDKINFLASLVCLYSLVSALKVQKNTQDTYSLESSSEYGNLNFHTVSPSAFFTFRLSGPVSKIILEKNSTALDGLSSANGSI